MVKVIIGGYKVKILITGSNGFLGQNIKKLKPGGIEFVDFDMYAGQDILSEDALGIIIMREKPDVVVHAAAVADLYESDKNLDKNFYVNVLGTYLIGRICAINEIPIVYISTCCAYGLQGARQMTDENSLPVPTECYAWSKLAGEAALGCVGAALKGCILRLGTFYGPDMRSTLFTSIVIEKALTNQEIEIHGNGEQTRRYIHVKDVSEAIISACRRIESISALPGSPLPIFNILGNTEYSVNDLIVMVKELIGVDIKTRFVDQREGQILRQQVNCDRAMTFLGFFQKISMTDGMRECIKDQAQRLGIDVPRLN